MCLINNYQRLIEFLLENAGVSIKYRVKKEILNVSVESDEMQALQAEILDLPRVRKAFAAQKEDGFIGNVIHGAYFDGFDSTVNLLKRYGVEISNPAMQRARECLLNWKDYEKDHFYQAGNAMDGHRRGGFRAILADNLKVNGDLIIDTLDEMYHSLNIVDFMKSSYTYCLKYETEIRAHIKLSEGQA